MFVGDGQDDLHVYFDNGSSTTGGNSVNGNGVANACDSKISIQWWYPQRMR
jgi:hypothetical protein